MNKKKPCSEKESIERDCAHCLEQGFCDWCPDEEELDEDELGVEIDG